MRGWAVGRDATSQIVCTMFGHVSGGEFEALVSLWLVTAIFIPSSNTPWQNPNGNNRELTICVRGWAVGRDATSQIVCTMFGPTGPIAFVHLCTFNWQSVETPCTQVIETGSR